MVEITSWTVVIAFFFSGLIGEAGRWFFQDHLKKHAEIVVNSAKNTMNKTCVVCGKRLQWWQRKFNYYEYDKYVGKSHGDCKEVSE